MTLFRRHRWFFAAAAVTLAFAIVSLLVHKSPQLTAFADITGLAVMSAGIAVGVANSIRRPASERSFWILISLGFSLWASNQAAWSYHEIVIRKAIPDPYFFDIILFFHSVPFIAAIAWRPDIDKKKVKLHLSLINFLMLLGWWSFLYAFFVFPPQYIVADIGQYNIYYDRLYGLENALLLIVLGLAVFTSSGGWRRLYFHFFAAGIVYGINSQFLDRAAAAETYYSGSSYDIALIATLSWMVATTLSVTEWNLQSVELSLHPLWKKLVPQLAMLTVLTLPLLGLWAIAYDQSPGLSREFRLFVVLAAMLFLGACVFLRQYLQDQSLIALLQESRRGYESQKSLQTELVQKEKLASLGSLVAGAAHEINHPLNAIMTQSELLWDKEGLTPDQHALLRKIVNQARRTRDLVTHLLSFAQQAPGEKTLIDLGILLHRATQLLESRRSNPKIRITLSVESDFPRVHGNANQLFQAFVEIIENALDALEDAGGGSLLVSAFRNRDQAVLHFSDTGLGIRQPERVFDPFYTTKPVGKGTGLGLSAVYGVIQEHQGQITCQNKPEGGALFILKFPVAAEPVPTQAAGAAGA